MNKVFAGRQVCKKYLDGDGVVPSCEKICFLGGGEC